MGSVTREDDSQNFTVNLDRQTHRRLKIQATDERRAMSVIVREAIRNYIDLAQAPNGRYKGPK